MDTASRQSYRSRASKAKGPGGDIVLLTDELELAMGKLKADAAERKAFKAMASPGWRTPLGRSFTEGGESLTGFRIPGSMTPTRSKMAGGNADSALETASLPGGRTGAVPRASTEVKQAGDGMDASSVVSVPVTRRKSTGNGEDDSSGATELAPDSPLSSHASSQAVSRYSAAYPDGAPLARLKHFDISAFSLASAPGSPQVSHAAPSNEALAEAPPLPVPGSPDYAQGSCFTFITPKQVDGSMLSPLGWLVSLICSYQTPVRERVQHLHVVRHAERIDAVDPAWRDSADRPWDPPLCENGKEQAYLVGARLRRENCGPYRVVCSPYVRCVETAAEIVKALMASDGEVAHRTAAAAAKAGPTAGVPVGGGVRSQAVNQMMTLQHHKGTAEGAQDMEGEAEAGAEGSRKVDGDGRRGKRARGSRKVRAYIDPGLCEIRTATANAVTPEGHPNDRVLLPREQLEGLLPRAALRPNDALPAFEAPSWPEDVDQGLHRLLGAGDRICEQYSSDNVILVTHSEAIHGSIMRCMKKAVVYNIRPGGYVHLERTVYEDEEDEEDRGVSPWKLVTRSGMTGVYFTG